MRTIKAMLLGHVQKAIVRHIQADKAGLIFEGMLPYQHLHQYTWPQIDKALQKLLRREILERVPGTLHCYRLHSSASYVPFPIDGTIKASGLTVTEKLK